MVKIHYVWISISEKKLKRKEKGRKKEGKRKEKVERGYV